MGKPSGRSRFYDPRVTLPPAAFQRLAPREQAALLRALRDAGREAEVPGLVHPPLSGPLVLDLLADALLSLGKPAEALAVVEHRETRGASSVTVGLKSRALARLGRVDEALALVPDDADAYLRHALRGEALLDAGRAADARREFEAAVALHPQRRRALLGLMQACAATGDWVTGSAYAGRLEATQNEEEGPLSVKYLEALRAFHAATGGAHRLAELDEEISARRREAEATLAGLQASAPAAPPPRPAPPPQAPPPAAAPDFPAGPPVAPGELAKAEALVRRHMGFPALREGQAETLARVLRGEDVLAVMPTGGGKSICYQLPGVLSSGVTLVVSPLLALMKDQLDGLPAPMRAAAVSITSELTSAQARRALEEVAQGRYRLVYAAPERLRQGGFLRALREAGVARLVVDEAHCVSVWGHDFRPDYLGIAEARRALGDPPILALTATAPPRVARDIRMRLGSLTLVRASIERPNLRFEAIVARDADEKLAHLLALCRETKGPGVVYASSRAKCEQLAAALQQAGVDALAYHAGLPDRAARQEAFMNNEVSVLVATVAFGMGVDKGDVRFVLHHDPATSLENYYQESGRAGRDGQPARCVLLATSQDGALLKQRARADLPSRDLLQRAWSLVLQAKDEDGYAVLDAEQAAGLGEDDDVKPRVALSILAEAGAVQRLADAPRTVRLDGREMGLFEASAKLGVPPEHVEAAALEKGGDTAGRALLYRVLGDVARVESVLERYAALAEQRAKEIMDYARTAGCRHAYLRRYFGESPPDRCGNCDNCLGITREATAASPQEDDAARRAILDLLQTVRGIGEVNLVWFLRGDQRTADWIRGRAGFGSLAMRSETRIKQLVRELESMGLVARETLSHGGTTLKVTPKGVDASFAPAPIVPPRPAAPPPRRAAPQPRRRDDAATPEEKPKEAPIALDADGQARFEALRAWRKETADAEGVPPYVVAHDSTLRLIADARPTTLEQLRGVKGMGPKKVEKYGEGILGVLNGR